MIYLDHGATSFPKPPAVQEAVLSALRQCGNPGRGGYAAAAQADRQVFSCRALAARMFDCEPEQVVFTQNCTHGLNIAIRTLVKPGERVVISGFEHNAVTRPLKLLNAQTVVAGRRLFDWEDTLEQFEKALKTKPKAAIFTHVSNVFGYMLPILDMGMLCRAYGVPFIVDAAQSAGVLPVSLRASGAAFIAMPGHKGLMGPQGTGLLLCGKKPEVLLAGGTGSQSENPDMPDFLPDRAEAGTLNVPGIAGLAAGMRTVERMGLREIRSREHGCMAYCAGELQKMDCRVFTGPHQIGTVSFVPPGDCEELAQALAQRGVAVRAGLHCAPLAHESAGTLKKGTVRLSFGGRSTLGEAEAFLRILQEMHLF